MRAAVGRAASALAAGARKHKDLLAVSVIVWYCAQPLAAARLFWDSDIHGATHKLLGAHLYFFDVALMILIAAVLTRRLTLPVFAVAFVLAATPEIQWLIDEGLHELLANAGVYHWIFGVRTRDQIVDPRTAKLVLFGLLTPVLLAQVLIARTRSVDRTFALMCTLVVIATTYLFHTALPGGTLRYIRKDAEYIARFVSTLEPPQAAAFCAHFGSNCIRVRGRSELEQELRSAGLKGMVDHLRKASDGHVISATTAVVVVDKTGRRHFNPVLTTFKVPKDEELTTLLIEPERSDMAQTSNERSFALLALAAHSFWTLFTAALCALHHWRGRGRIFARNV